MIVVADLLELRTRAQGWRQGAETIAFVPTMGNLHAGHLSLVEQAHSLADRVVVSIFVNPLQFGPTEDFDAYPRGLEEDLSKLQTLSVDLVFTPSEESLFPEGREQQARVMVPIISAELCGASRPHFFPGIATAVTKYFNLIQPTVTILGQKDYQQCLVIKQLIRDLNMPIECVIAPTVRESDGLAMSSRNQYLTSSERELAPQLYQTLQRIADSVKRAEPGKNLPQLTQSLCRESCFELEKNGFCVDYLTVRHRHTLNLPSANDSADDLIIAAAAMLGKTRLIDNLLLS